MPQSLSQLDAHWIFSTRDRFPFPKDHIRERVHSELRDIAVQQIVELQTTLKRLDAITGKQADREVIGDIRSNLKNHIELFSKWFGTSPIED